jgi:hypothetical protein
MRGERQQLRLGEHLVRRACQRLPRDIREERYREWAAELPAILHDPQIRLGPCRAVRMLGYAADTLRCTVMTALRARSRAPGMTAVLSLLLVACLAVVVSDIWAIVRAPEHGVNYLQLASGLLFAAFPISLLIRSAARVTTLIFISGTLAGVAVYLWSAVQAPRDRANYLVVAWLCLLLLIFWLVRRWARFTHAAR